MGPCPIQASKLGIRLEKGTHHVLGAPPVSSSLYSRPRNLFWFFCLPETASCQGPNLDSHLLTTPMISGSRSSVGFSSPACSVFRKLDLAVIPCLGHLSRFQSGGLPCDLNSLKNLRKVIDFQFVQPFSCCEGINSNFQA